MSMQSMQLCLVNNNPISTVLITPDGQPLFSIETPRIPTGIAADGSLSAPGPRTPTTMTRIKRLERYHLSTGHTETEIGVVEYQGPDKGCHLQLSSNNHTLAIAPHHDPCRTIAETEQNEQTGVEEEYHENSWEFTTADSERYMWKMFAHTPVLVSASNSVIPVARYRRAKIGIISRSRRAFLEIFPAGLAIIDLIVVTFVAFMKQRILIDQASSTDDDVPNPVKPPMKPPTGTSRSTPEIPQLSTFASRHPHTLSPHHTT